MPFDHMCRQAGNLVRACWQVKHGPGALLRSQRCKIACKSGSGAYLVQEVSICAEQPRFEKIEFGAAIHLAFDELELGDLSFGLSVGP